MPEPPPPAFSILPLGPADVPAILSVYRQCEDFLALGPESQASEAMVQRDLAASQALGSRYCGIYTLEGCLVGILDYLPSGFEGQPEHACIELLMLARGERRRGLGQAVCAWVEEQVFANPAVTVIWLGVQVNNPTAQRFWRHCGFRQASPPRRLPDQTTAFLMRKERA
jgi:ribosomal protein S18 acetylase RimI-like enzyme